MRLASLSVIAIVDDDRAMRAALCDLLEVEGFRASAFAGGAQFLDRADAFDCVITDVSMPGIDGIALQRQLRARGSAIPVIFVTAIADPATCACAMRDGASAWLAKPVAEAALFAALDAALPWGG